METSLQRSSYTLECFEGIAAHVPSQYLGQRGRRVKSGFEVNLGYVSPIFLFYSLKYVLWNAELWL